MLNLFNHTHNLRSCNHFTGVIDALQTKSLHRAFLTSRTADDASDLFDSEFLFCHILNLLLLTVKHFVERNTTELGNHIRILHLEECIDSSLHHTMGIRRALAFCKHVLHSNTLKYCTHSTTSDNTRTRGCRFQENFCTTVFATLLVGNSALQNGDADKVLLGIINTFLHCSLNLLSFAKTVSYNTVFISNNDNGSKGESSTTFGDLGDAIDCNKTIFKFDLA